MNYVRPEVRHFYLLLLLVPLFIFYIYLLHLILYVYPVAIFYIQLQRNPEDYTWGNLYIVLKTILSRNPEDYAPTSTNLAH